MPLHDTIRIRHIIDTCDEIISFTEGLDLEDLLEDRKLQLSLVRLIEIIGEAANGIKDETKESMPDIPWPDIIGMRNRLVHGYFDIDLHIVWTTAKKEVPELRDLMVKYMDR